MKIKKTTSEINVQTTEGPSAECAGCGSKNPEYVLEDRQLCLDCYKSEVESSA